MRKQTSATHRLSCVYVSISHTMGCTRTQKRSSTPLPPSCLGHQKSSRQVPCGDASSAKLRIAVGYAVGEKKRVSRPTSPNVVADYGSEKSAGGPIRDEQELAGLDHLEIGVEGFPKWGVCEDEIGSCPREIRMVSCQRMKGWRNTYMVREPRGGRIHSSNNHSPTLLVRLSIYTHAHTIYYSRSSF